MNALFRYTTLRHLRSATTRSALTVIGIALGVALYVAIRLCNQSVTDSFRGSLEAISGAATLEVIGGENGFNETVFETVIDTSGVVAAAPVIQATVSLDRDPAIPLTILGLDPFSEGPFRARQTLEAHNSDGGEDEDLDRFLLDPTAILLTGSFVGTHRLAEGAPLRVLYHDRALTLAVAGFLTPSALTRALGGHIAVMDIASAQWALERVGRLDRVDILTAPAADPEAVRSALQARLPAGVVVQRPEQRLAQTEQVLRAFQLNLTALSGIALLVGLFLIYNTMTYALLRRRAEIGLLRALGVTRGRLLRTLTVESLAFGAVGGGLGIPLGWLLARGALETVSRTVEALYQAAPASAVTLTPSLVTEGFALGGGVALLAALVPIAEALRTVPREVLHAGWVERRAQLRAGWVALAGVSWLLLAIAAAQAGPVAGVPLFGYAAALGIVLGGACLVPLLGVGLGRMVDPWLLRLGWTLARVAGGTLSAAPGRTAVAAGALLTALAMTVSVIVMVGSFRRTVEHWIAETMSADLFVTPAARAAVGPAAHFQDETVVSRLASTTGVAAVDPYRALPIEYDGRSILLSAREIALVAERSTMLFQTGEPRAVLGALAAGKGVAVSEVLARFHRLTVGDRLALPTPGGTMAFPILGVFYDYSTDGGRVLMDRSLFRRYWNDTGVTAAAVYLAPGADPEDVRAALFRSVAPAHRVAITTNGELKREVLDIFDRTFAITRALEVVALVVAVLAIANTVLTIVFERRRELGILRALGTTRAGIRRIVLCQAGLIGVLGAILGVATGYAVALVLIRVINLQSFGWTIRFWWGPTEVLQAAVLALIAALAAGWFPARHAARSPIVEVLTDE